MARHVMCNLAPNLVYIFDGSVSDFSVSILNHEFRQRGSFYSDGRIKHNFGLQPSVVQADCFRVQRSVSFLVAKYDLQNEQILDLHIFINCKNITFLVHTLL